LKKRFLVTTIAGCALAAWLVKTIAGGILYATAAFFTKEGWERWKSRRGFWD
jgi:hypothetical protein